MGNTVNVQFTKFVGLDENGNDLPEASNFGYRIYDDYGKAYSNNFESYEAVVNHFKAKGITEVISEEPEFRDIDCDSCRGVDFNGEFLEWDEDGLLADPEGW